MLLLHKKDANNSQLNPDSWLFGELHSEQGMLLCPQSLGRSWQQRQAGNHEPWLSVTPVWKSNAQPRTLLHVSDCFPELCPVTRQTNPKGFAQQSSHHHQGMDVTPPRAGSTKPRPRAEQGLCFPKSLQESSWMRGGVLVQGICPAGLSAGWPCSRF